MLMARIALMKECRRKDFLVTENYYILSRTLRTPWRGLRVVPSLLSIHCAPGKAPVSISPQGALEGMLGMRPFRILAFAL